MATVNTLEKDQNTSAYLADVKDTGDAAHFERYDSDEQKTPSSLEAAPIGGSRHLDAGFLPEEVKRITRKIDWRLIPTLSMMYAISLIDR